MREAQLRALHGLAALRTGAADTGDLLRRAAALAAEGAGCAFAALVIGDGAFSTVCAATAARPSGVEALLRLQPGSPGARALASTQPVISVSSDGPHWVLQPIAASGDGFGAVLVAGPFATSQTPDLLFLKTFATFVAADAARAWPGLPAEGASGHWLRHIDAGAIIESSEDAIALYDAEGRLLLTNAVYRAQLSDAGLTAGPLNASPDIVMPRDRAGRRVKPGESVLARALAGSPARAERVLRMADGRDRHYTVIGRPLRSRDGALIGAIIVLHDVSEQIARERALRLMEEVRRGLSLSGDVRQAARAVCRRVVSHLAWVDMAAVFGLDSETTVFLAQAGFSARAAALLSAAPMGPTHKATQAALENRATVFQTDRDEPASEASRRVIAASGATTFINLPLVAGARRFGLITLVSREPHRPGRDELALLEALAAQIGAELESVRKREEAETERTRLQAVLDQLPEGVLLFDAGGRLVMSNRSAEEILGQTVQPSTPLVTFAAHYGFLHSDGRTYQPGDEPIARTFSTGRPVLGEEQLVRRGDGRDLPVVSNVAPVRDANGQLAAAIMVFQDITALREMDRLKDEFLTIAGHELRGPITSIRGLAQLLERRYDRLEQSTIAGALSTILEQTEQMSKLVDELLDVSRIRTGRLSLAIAPCDIAAVLRTAVQRSRLHHEGEIRLMTPETLPANSDASRLQQVFANLLDNAAKYSDPRAPIDVTAVVANGEARIAFTDRGIGVPRDAQERLFERFFRAENAALHAGGLGLGLYLCREIVERLGGRISVVSVPDEGSTFTVTLPLAGSESARG